MVRGFEMYSERRNLDCSNKCLTNTTTSRNCFVLWIDYISCILYTMYYVWKFQPMMKFDLD